MPPEQNFLQRFAAGIFQRKETRRIWFLAFLSVVILLGAFYLLFVKAPEGFPVKKIISIENNSSLNDIAEKLFEEKAVRSKFWFRAAVILFSGEKGVLAGDYLFKSPKNLFTVARRLVRGEFGLTPIRITFPEGATAKRMAVILENALTDFDTAEFLRLAVPKEGYLFPDTYLFLPNAKPDVVLKTMEENFSRQIKKLQSEMAKFGRSLKETVVMASIIEAEARTAETRRVISGILWKRLRLGMPLQVDAPFEYIIGKNTFQLTATDLKIDSPYNTYLYKGLPPGAIGNPSLDALHAALAPEESPYFYYLSDIRGGMHYAKTYEEHLANKARYIQAGN